MNPALTERDGGIGTMSGEQDRGGAKPARNPFFDEADAPPIRRVARPKPPPGIISAGGVDMARAHASGILIREATAAETTLDEPRVVVGVETDPRKVPTHRTLIEGREAREDGARSAMLPGAGGDAPLWTPAAIPPPSALPPTAAPPVDPRAATIERDRQALPPWMRVAVVLVLLLLVAGLVRRLRLALAVPDEPAVTAQVPPPTALSPLPPPPLAPTPAATAVPEPATAAPSRPAVTGEPTTSPTSPTAPTAPTASPTAPTAPTASPTAPAPTRPAGKPAAPQKPSYTPPFQMPGEKN